MDASAEQFARLDRFAELLAAHPVDVPLDRAAVAIAAVLRPHPLTDAVATLDALAAGCPEPTLDGLRRYVYGDLCFAGPTGEYDDPRHSMIDVVLTHRRGLPILLATVMIEA